MNLPQINKTLAILIAGLLSMFAIAPEVEAGPKKPIITSVELDLDAGKMIVTGRYFGTSERRIRVRLHLAEAGPVTLQVDSLTKLQLTEEVPTLLDQLIVSGLPLNIDEFAGMHRLEVRKKKFIGTTTVTIGAEGPAGADGAYGPAGPKGEQGLPGAQGPQGADGTQGERGPEGPQGPAGVGGTDGVDGVDGTSVVLLGSVADFASLPEGATQGDLWVTLDTGAGWVSDGAADWTNVGQIQGPEGPKGEQGVAGPAGPTGADGLKGDIGPKGDQGDQGVVGPTGPKGDTGPQGPQGVAGPQGPQGVAGPQGPQGVAGPQGLKGDTGATGLQGTQGPQGIKGDMGLIGPKGDQGVVGPIGPEGPQGPAGSDGNILLDGLKMVRGSGGGDGTLLQGEGFTVTRASTGRYSITFDEAFQATPTVVATSHGEGTIRSTSGASILNLTSDGFDLYIWQAQQYYSLPVDTSWHFIVIGQ